MDCASCCAGEVPAAPEQVTMSDAPDQQAMEVPESKVWKNVSGSPMAYRSEPDMEKKAGTVLSIGATVSGVLENGWCKTDDGLYLPMVHPTTGAALLSTAPAPGSARSATWKNVSGSPMAYRSEPVMEKRAGTVLSAGSTVSGVLENGWCKTDDGLYLPMVHPTTGAGLLAPAEGSDPIASGDTPPGAPPGGKWMEASYVGPLTTCIYCFLCWCIVFCPVDKKQVYEAPNGKKYNPSGKEFQNCCGGD